MHRIVQTRSSRDLVGFVSRFQTQALDDLTCDATHIQLREKKGMTDVAARRFLRDDFTWYATMMMHMGKCDGMVSGACHTTADTMRPGKCTHVFTQTNSHTHEIAAGTCHAFSF